MIKSSKNFVTIQSRQNIIIEVHIGDNKHVIITEPKNFHFGLTKDIGENLKHENGPIIKQHNDIFGEHTPKITHI